VLGASSADRVITTWVPGMATGDPPRAHPAASEQAVFLDRLLGVMRTRRFEPTTRGQPREDEPVEPDEPDPDTFQPAEPPSAPPLARVRRSAPTIASWSAVTIDGRAMMRTSQPGWNEGAITLSASRRRRRTRLRTTAPPRFRPVDSPKRVVSRSVRRNRAVRNGWDRVVPLPWNAAKSCGLESITSRGVFEPRPIVRPSAAFDRERDVSPGPAGHRPTSSWRGSRAPLRGDASWADRSASSGLFGILSIRPRGRQSLTPEGTQTRLAPESARRVVVRRMISRTKRTLRHAEIGSREGRGVTPAAGRGRRAPRPRRGIQDLRSYTPWEYRRNALRGPGGRCYPLRALDAGDVRGSPRKPGPGSSGTRHPVPP
jgi:hypothetical protein